MILPAAVLLALAAPGAASRPCTPATAAPATIETVRGDYARWRGRCVTVTGIAIGDHLYADRQALLEPATAYGEDQRGSVVLYRSAVRLPGSPRLVSVTGVIGSCADENATVEAAMIAEPDAIIMVSGYCHTSLEVYVRVSALRVLSQAPVTRPTEAEVPVSRRELIDAPATDRHAASAVGARALALALASGDEAAWFRLTRPDAQAAADATPRGPTPPWVTRHRREARRAFAAARPVRRAFAALPPVSSRQERVFVSRRWQEPGAIPDDGLMMLCWCRGGDCTGRWPVREADADNDPTRPYLCLRAGTFFYGSRRLTSAWLPDRSDGLTEPRWPR